MIQPKTLEELKQLLQAAGVDLTQWGVGTAKRIEDLLHEIVVGESQLQFDPLQRYVPVARVTIRQNGKVLKEIEQLYSDGRTRKRNRKPAEKMKPDETISNAALRCLEEELEVDPAHVTILLETYEVEHESLSSPSYPGLMTQYQFHTIEALVPNLPNDEFWTNEAASNQVDLVSKHLWGWVTEEPQE